MRSEEALAGGRSDLEAPSRRTPPLADYANYFEVGHNAFGFLLDVGQVEPQSGEIHFTGRIAISPVHAKLLTDLFVRSISQFEALHGSIPSLVDDDEADTLALTAPDEFERRALDARRRAAAANVPSSASPRRGAPPATQER